MNAITLQGRGLGDAVICATVLRTLSVGGDIPLIIAGKPSNLRVMRKLGVHAEWLEVPFPVSTGKRCDLRSLWTLASAAIGLRRRNLSLGINSAPDFREDTFFRLVRPKRMLRAFYGFGNDATEKYRQYSLLSYGESVDLGGEKRGIYWQQAGLFASALGRSMPDDVVPVVRSRNSDKCVVGVHPFAGHPSREWPLEKWRALLRRLQQRGLETLCFCPLGEKHRLEEAGIADGPHANVLECSFEEFCDSVRNLSLLLCHESFAAHVAISYGIPRLVVSGSGDPAVWLNGRDYLSAAERCRWFPCYGRPKCRAQTLPYECINGVGVDEVEHRAVKELEKVRTGAC